MQTHLILGSSISGGSVMFAMPLAFASLLSWRFPDRATIEARPGAAPEKASTLEAIVPANVESLAAHRERRRASAPGTRAEAA